MDPPAQHKYSYATGNPTNRHDPSGNVSIAEVSLVNNITSIISNFQSAQGQNAQDTILEGDNAALTGFALDAITLTLSLTPVIGGVIAKAWDFVPFGGYFTRKAWRRVARFAKAAKHYDKHIEATTIEKAIELSHSRSQFLPGLQTWEMGKVGMWAAVRNKLVKETEGNAMYFYHRFEDFVGYDKGEQTRWIKVVVSGSENFSEYHSYPLRFSEIKNELRDITTVRDLYRMKMI